MLTHALRADLNVRWFASLDAASLAAVEPALRPPVADLGALNGIVENLPPEDRAAILTAAPGLGVIAHAVGDVLWLSGSPERLGALAGAARTPVAAEIAASLGGYLAARASPRPTLVMGVLNVTPDSFSDGGSWLDPQAAIARGLEMLAEGADVLDIGGESTRPGAAEVPEAEELARVLPVIAGLRAETRAPISIDTRKAAVAAGAVESGADWINDISGLTFDPDLVRVAARHPHTQLVLMHSRSRPSDERYSTEYDAEGLPVYKDVVADTLRWLRRQATEAVAAGVAPERIWLDPGFGFGKTFAQNVELLRRVREYTSAGLPVLVGTSRKSSVGRLAGDLPPDQRVEATAATVAWAIAQGAAAVRVHDVQVMKRIARVADALR